ncbi:MAG: sulfurtransferase-like selenium metabolism protein YedF [Chloroflexi bacterium]|nr:sulfurtransferase-like selenium metabolism protein YedF [Chloroflexota bacterium]
MVVEKVDARGLPCPQPVILTRRALQTCDALVTLVDNETAQQNVTRMAERAGCTVRAERTAEGICLHIAKAAADQSPAAAVAQPVAASPAAGAGPLALVVGSEFMGRGEDAELGSILIRAFFHTLGEVTPQPDVIVFFNSGVKLVVEGSPVLPDLLALRDGGIEILACGTCLGQFGLKDKVAVGVISNMYAIAEAMLGAAKVVQL